MRREGAQGARGGRVWVKVVSGAGAPRGRASRGSGRWALRLAAGAGRPEVTREQRHAEERVHQLPRVRHAGDAAALGVDRPHADERPLGSEPVREAPLRERLDLSIHAVERQALATYGQLMSVDGRPTPSWLIADGAGALQVQRPACGRTCSENLFLERRLQDWFEELRRR